MGDYLGPKDEAHAGKVVDTSPKPELGLTRVDYTAYKKSLRSRFPIWLVGGIIETSEIKGGEGPDGFEIVRHGVITYKTIPNLLERVKTRLQGPQFVQF